MSRFMRARSDKKEPESAAQANVIEEIVNEPTIVIIGENDDFDHQPLIVEEIESEQAPNLFCDRPVTSSNEAAQILHFGTSDASKISFSVPQKCPENARSATFLVDLTQLPDLSEIDKDAYGSWSFVSSNKSYYLVSPKLKKVSRVWTPKCDFVIKRTKFLHRDTGNRLCKIIHRYVDRRGVELWALISYDWGCEPFLFTPSGENAIGEEEQEVIAIVDDDITDQPNIAPETQFAPGVRLFCRKSINTIQEASRILRFEVGDPETACTAMPSFCPSGVRTATFLIDLSSPSISSGCVFKADAYGKWGNALKKRNKKNFYREAQIGFQKLYRVCETEAHDFAVKSISWSHPNTDNKFFKHVYRYIDSNGQELFALISYEWTCEPFEFDPTPSKPNVGRPAGIEVSDTRVGPKASIRYGPEDESILPMLSEQLPPNVHLFSTRPVHFMHDAAILTQFQSHTRLCTDQPTFCPDGTRSCTYLVDLSCSEANDLTKDDYGRWGPGTGNKGFFRVDCDSRTVHKMDPANDQWDVMIHRMKYWHPDANKKLTRTIFWQSDSEMKLQMAVLSYHWECEPFEFAPTLRSLAGHKMSFRYSPGRYKKRKTVTLTEEAYPSPSPQISESEWQQLLTKSKMIAQKGKINEFPGQKDLGIVIYGRTSSTVQRKSDAEFTCNCDEFSKFKHVCSHTIANARCERMLAEYLDGVTDAFRRAQVAPIKSRPILNRVPIPSAKLVEAVQETKAPIYTEPYHNDNPFTIVMLQQDVTEAVDQKMCKHCQVDLPLRSLLPPENMAIAHEERVFDPVTGKYGREFKIQLIHARYACMVQRYAYFHVGLLEMSQDTFDQLTDEHRRHLKEQFGVDVFGVNN